jgi:lysophospholipase L1-like esterase
MAMPATAPTGSAPAQSDPTPRVAVTDLSDRVLATWGSSVCDGFSVPAGTAWPWTLEKKLTEIHGPKVLHASTSGHTTDSKESALERSKVESADFVVVCLSLGNQGLGNATTDASAQAVVDSYIDDIFTDESDTDGDPVSMVHFIESRAAQPIVTLVYPDG